MPPLAVISYSQENYENKPNHRRLADAAVARNPQPSFSLKSANWVPQITNQAGTNGVLVFTNPPVATTNNFWRVRSVP